MNNPLISRFKEIRQHTEFICSYLSAEDHQAQPVVDVSPPKWHLAHTTWFFETFVLSSKESYQVFDVHFSTLFNSYYNNVGQRVPRDKRGGITRPSVAEVMQYRAFVNNAMEEFIDALNAEDYAKWEPVIELGLQHEQQHQELLYTDIKYILSCNPIYPKYQKPNPLMLQNESDGGFVSVNEGVYSIGYAGNGFCFDNELNQHKVYVQPFSIAKQLVTNKEYLAFMNAGAYADFNLWHDEGWAWVNSQQIKCPQYWVMHNGKWHEFTLAGLEPIDWDAPVKHVSYFEAWAFAHWKGMRLPTEQEWEIANNQFNWGQLWEWTNSAYLPYPGYQKAAGAIGEYNGKFMINQMVLRGASVATSPNHSRATYRNFFHPQLRWQFTGIRLAK